MVVVANHPFGVLDGIVISHLIAKVRMDFKVLTHNALYRAPEVQPFVLPIDFALTPAAQATNLRSRAGALELLGAGGCLVVFPSGAVSTARTPFAREAIDCAWKPFTARAIIQHQATVVPVYFVGQNSRLFQVASHLNQTLRLALLFHEVRNKIGRAVSVRIGAPIAYDALGPIGDRHALTEHLRRITYALAPEEARRAAAAGRRRWRGPVRFRRARPRGLAHHDPGTCQGTAAGSLPPSDARASSAAAPISGP